MAGVTFILPCLFTDIKEIKCSNRSVISLNPPGPLKETMHFGSISQFLLWRQRMVQYPVVDD